MPIQLQLAMFILIELTPFEIQITEALALAKSDMRSPFNVDDFDRSYDMCSIY